MEKIAEIESFPDGKHAFVKTTREEGIPERKVCKDFKFKGHTTAECWGKCQHCGRYGHRSQMCRTKIKLDQAEALKKAAAADARKKTKGKKKMV